MKSKFLLTILSVVTVSAVTTAQTKSEVSESQPNTVDYEQELYLQNILYGSSNPVSIANNPYTVINSFDGSYSRSTKRDIDDYQWQTCQCRGVPLHL